MEYCHGIKDHIYFWLQIDRQQGNTYEKECDCPNFRAKFCQCIFDIQVYSVVFFGYSFVHCQTIDVGE